IGKVAADFGASTGGFTDCLLQRGTARVYAIDVGYGQLAEKLRLDPRVIVMDRQNVRAVTDLPEPVEIISIDVSFIGLHLVLPAALAVLAPGGEIVALVKPQFEAGRADVGKGGVVRDPAVHERVLREVIAAADALGLGLHGATASPLRGPAGNREFLIHLRPGPAAVAVDDTIAAALREDPSA
ncbi:MAG: TlyA family RNA methyltransferase, partial [Thermomicrobiales bacterium]